MSTQRPQTERELLPSIPAGNGTTFRFYIDSAKSDDDIESRHLEVIYDGKPQTPVFRVPPHWHSDHDEHWTMLEGRMIATIDGKDVEMKVGDAEVVVPAGVVHCFRSVKGVPAVLKECSAPPGPWKALNMRDIFQLGSGPTFWLAVRANWDGATYLHLGGPLLVDRLFMYMLGPISKMIAPRKPHEGSTRAPKGSMKQLKYSS